MRRLLVLLSVFSLALGASALGTAGLTACGGNDKPPLTPDSVEPDGVEAGTPGAPSAPTPPK